MRCWLWLIFLIIVLLTRSLRSEIYDEYTVKAAYLYNFTKFVEWPPGTFPATDSPLVICVSSENPFGGALATLHGKTVADHPVEVRLISLAARLDRCHVIFIGRTNQGNFKTVLTKLARLPILTVSDINDFTQSGGIIELFDENQRIRFSINITVARQANLKLSSQLLKLAVIVD